MSRQRTLAVELSAGLPSNISTSETLAVGVFTDEPRAPGAAALGERLRALCEQAAAEGEFKGEEEATLLIHAAGERGDGSRRVLLVGLGSHVDFTRAALRRAAGVAVHAARASRSRALHFVLPPSGEPSRGALAALAEGAHLGLYDNGFYQT